MRSIREQTVGDYVFVNDQGLQVQKDHLSSIARKTADSIRLKNFIIYDLRHSYITRLMQANLNAEHIRRAVGHGSLDMTQNYIHMDDKTIRQAVASVTENCQIKPRNVDTFGHIGESTSTEVVN